MVRKTEGQKAVHHEGQTFQATTEERHWGVEVTTQIQTGDSSTKGDQEVPDVDMELLIRKLPFIQFSQGDSPGDQNGYVPDPCYSFGDTRGC